MMKSNLTILILIASWIPSVAAQDAIYPSEGPRGGLLPGPAVQQDPFGGFPAPTNAVTNQLRSVLDNYQNFPENSPQRAAIRAEVAQLLARQYDQHLEQQVQQVAALESRLEKLRQLLNRRLAAKDKLVELKLELMLSHAEGLGWPESPSLSFPRPMEMGGMGSAGRFGGPGDMGMGGGGSGMSGGGRFGRPGGGGMGGESPSNSTPPIEGAPFPPRNVRDPLAGQRAIQEAEGQEKAAGQETFRWASGASGTNIEKLKAVMLAVYNYESAWNRLPFNSKVEAGATERPNLSWLVRVLPYLDGQENAELYSQFDVDQNWDSPQNKPLLNKIPTLLGNDGQTKDGQTKIRWVESNVGTIGEITDGTSNTIALIHGGPAVNWTENKPLSQAEALERFQSLKPGEELLVAMYDGSVRRVTKSIGRDNFQAMLTPSGGETIR